MPYDSEHYGRLRKCEEEIEAAKKKIASYIKKWERKDPEKAALLTAYGAEASKEIEKKIEELEKRHGMECEARKEQLENRRVRSLLCVWGAVFVSMIGAFLGKEIEPPHPAADWILWTGVAGCIIFGLTYNSSVYGDRDKTKSKLGEIVGDIYNTKILKRNIAQAEEEIAKLEKRSAGG